MRTLRLSLLGTMILALLGGLSGAVLAQEEEGTEPVSATYFDGVRHWRDPGPEGEFHYLMEMSDPRASGMVTEYGDVGHEYKFKTPDPPQAWMVPMLLENDEGTWEGVGSWVYHPEMGWHGSAWMTGDGAYEGLTVYLHAVRDRYSHSQMPFEGVIFEGPTPPMLGAVTMPTE